VEAMTLHLAELVAFFADVPIQVQCIQQATQEPGWKWWLGALAPWVGPILSTTGSVYVAWWVFTRQSRKDTSAWIRGQKVEEWKGLIELVAEYQRLMPAAQPGSSTVNALRNDVLPLCDRVVHASARALLISPILSDHGIRLTVFQIIQEVDRSIGRIDIFPQSSQEEKIKLGTPLDNAMAIRAQLEKLHTKLIVLAQQDLNL
jgi:hypothetical protein